MGDFPPVIILAGGLGTRISPMYPDLPKALIPINNEPFIVHQLRLLARESVNEVILCVGHLSDQLRDYVGAGKDFGINVSYSYDGDKLLGTGGAVLKAMQNTSGSFAVLYGDSYLDTSFSSIKKAFYESKKLGLMTVYKNNNQWDKSNILCESGLVVAYNKKEPGPDMQFIDYGLSIFDHEAFKGFANKPFDLSEVFSSLINKKQLAAYRVKDRFYEIGSPSGLEALRTYLSSKSPSFNN
jgi:N-acetyl-alpha-D-muramate 1-phosphate uridylyltransferase